MAARAVASCTISFGLVSIPVKMFTAASSEQVRFNMLSKKTGSRVKMQYVDASTEEVVERSDTVKGYEYAKGQYVTFTEEELKALEVDRRNAIEIKEFVPARAIDLVQLEKSYYLGPDKGGDRAYKLLSQVMEEEGVVAIGTWAARGKEQLVAIRPYSQGDAKAGLAIHQLYFASEVRSFGDIDKGGDFEFADAEKDLARKLVEQLSTASFDASKYRDLFADRVRAAVEQKVAGQEITVAQEAPQAQIIDLFEALKRSLATTEAAPAAARTEPQATSPSATPASESVAAGDSSEPVEQRKPAAKPVKKASPRSRSKSKKSAAG